MRNVAASEEEFQKWERLSPKNEEKGKEKPQAESGIVISAQVFIRALRTKASELGVHKSPWAV